MPSETPPLPRGVTGFFAAGSPPGGGGVPLSTLAAWGHAAARALGATVEGPFPAAVTPNFHQLALNGNGRTEPPWSVAVLCNACYPIVAFARSLSDGDAPDFLPPDAPPTRLREVWESFGPRPEVWTRDRLLAPLSPHLVRDLDATELRQFKYWRPETVGDVVFNHWD